MITMECNYQFLQKFNDYNGMQLSIFTDFTKIYKN